MKPLHLLILLILIVSHGFSAGTDLSGLPPCRKDAAGRLVVDNLLQREFLLYRDHGLHYAEACAAVGALRLADRLCDKEMEDRLAQRYAAFLEPGNALASTGQEDLVWALLQV